MNWKLNSHETIEGIFLKKEKFNKDSKILIIDPTDYVPLFDLAENLFDGKIIVKPTTLENAVKEYVKRVGEILKKIYNIELDEKIVTEILKNKKDFYSSLELMRFLRDFVAKYVNEKYSISKIDLDYALKNAGL